MRWNKSFEGTLHIYDADLQKMAKMLDDVNIKECPYFDLSDRYGNSARYYRENQWIPCSERLPFAEYGESNNVFATCGHREDEDPEYRWIKMLYFNGGNWCYPTGETYLEKVYAWRPLPEPYKEGNDEIN